MQVLVSAILGFLSWNFYLTMLIMIVLASVLWKLAVPIRRRRSPDLAVIALATAILLTSGMLPYANAAYLRAVGVQQPAVIERVESFQMLRAPGTGRQTYGYRYHLRMMNADGSTWTTIIYRNAGVLGPYFFADDLPAAGDHVMISYVEGWPRNVTLNLAASDVVWQTMAQRIERGWDNVPPGDSWVMQKVHRDRIDEFMDTFGTHADADTIARPEAMRLQLTEMPPEGIFAR